MIDQYETKTSFFFRGGFNGSTRMNSGERYNPKTNSWMPMADMYNPRSNFAIEVNRSLNEIRLVFVKFRLLMIIYLLSVNFLGSFIEIK